MVRRFYNNESYENIKTFLGVDKPKYDYCYVYSENDVIKGVICFRKTNNINIKKALLDDKYCDNMYYVSHINFSFTIDIQKSQLMGYALHCMKFNNSIVISDIILGYEHLFKVSNFKTIVTQIGKLKVNVFVYLAMNKNTKKEYQRRINKCFIYRGDAKPYIKIKQNVKKSRKLSEIYENKKIYLGLCENGKNITLT